MCTLNHKFEEDMISIYPSKCKKVYLFEMKLFTHSYYTQTDWYIHQIKELQLILQ